MTLNRNGQAITLSSELQEKGVTDLGGLKKLIDQQAPGSYTFAHTFPTGTHAMWLYYWLASGGIHPFDDIRTVVVPPPQMVMNMRIGNMSGFCVGEPWNARAINDRIGFTAATSQDIWPEHPEKILGTRSEWVERNPNTARALVAAVMEASRWIEASPENTRETARILAKRAWLNTKEQYLTGRMLGEYDNGLGRRWQDAHPIRFYDRGEVSFPWLSDGMWFMTQFRRWGLLKAAPDYQAVAQRINRIDVWKEAAQAVGGEELDDGGGLGPRLGRRGGGDRTGAARAGAGGVGDPVGLLHRLSSGARRRDPDRRRGVRLRGRRRAAV